MWLLVFLITTNIDKTFIIHPQTEGHIHFFADIPHLDIRSYKSFAKRYRH
jgi:hypothetical protein